MSRRSDKFLFSVITAFALTAASVAFALELNTGAAVQTNVVGTVGNTVGNTVGSDTDVSVGTDTRVGGDTRAYGTSRSGDVIIDSNSNVRSSTDTDDYEDDTRINSTIGTSADVDANVGSSTKTSTRGHKLKVVKP